MKTFYRIGMVAVLLSVLCLLVVSTRAQGEIDLLDDLIAYWPGNEESGVAYDLHSNELDLTDNNTVGSGVGMVYPLARQYILTNSEYHSHVDDALLSMGDSDFTLSAWVYMDSKPVQMFIMSKDDNSSMREYILGYIGGGTDRFSCYLFNGSNVIGTVTANALGSPSTDTWYFILAWHNSISDTVSISVNNGPINSASTTGVPGDTTTAFMLGGRSTGGAYFNGRIGPAMMWRRILTADERAALYNAGDGLAYSEFSESPEPTPTPSPTPDQNHPSTPQPASLDAMTDAGEDILRSSAATLIPMIIGLTIGLGIVVMILRYMRWL